MQCILSGAESRFESALRSVILPQEAPGSTSRFHTAASAVASALELKAQLLILREEAPCTSRPPLEKIKMTCSAPLPPQLDSPAMRLD